MKERCCFVRADDAILIPITMKEFEEMPYDKRFLVEEKVHNNVKAAIDEFCSATESMKNTAMLSPRIKINVPYRPRTIADTYGINMDMLWKFMRQKRTDNPKARLIPVLTDILNKTGQELFGLDMIPLELPGVIKTYLRCYKKLRGPQLKHINKIIEKYSKNIVLRSLSETDNDDYDGSCDNPAALYLTYKGAFTTAPDKIYDLIKLRIDEYCESNNIRYNTLMCPNRSKSFVSVKLFIIDTVCSAGMESVVHLSLWTGMPVDYYTSNDYSAYPNITMDGKPITAKERQILSDFLIAGENKEIWNKVVEYSIYNDNKIPVNI